MRSQPRRSDVMFPEIPRDPLSKRQRVSVFSGPTQADAHASCTAMRGFRPKKFGAKFGRCSCRSPHVAWSSNRAARSFEIAQVTRQKGPWTRVQGPEIGCRGGDRTRDPAGRDYAPEVVTNVPCARRSASRPRPPFWRLSRFSNLRADVRSSGWLVHTSRHGRYLAVQRDSPALC